TFWHSASSRKGPVWGRPVKRASLALTSNACPSSRSGPGSKASKGKVNSGATPPSAELVTASSCKTPLPSTCKGCYLPPQGSLHRPPRSSPETQLQEGADHQPAHHVQQQEHDDGREVQAAEGGQNPAKGGQH